MCNRCYNEGRRVKGEDYVQLDAMTVEEIWQLIEEKANEVPIESFDGIEANALFHIESDVEETYTLQITKERVSVHKGELESTHCTFHFNEKYFKRLLAGSLNALTAYMTGKINVSGDLQLAMKLEQIMRKFSKEI